MFGDACANVRRGCPWLARWNPDRTVLIRTLARQGHCVVFLGKTL